MSAGKESMRIRIGIAVALASIASGASAADWTFDPRITLRYDSDDNNRLTNVPGQEISVSGALLDAQVALRARTPRSTFRLVPRIRATAYPDEPDDETTDGFLRMDWEFRGERSAAAVDLNYAHRTVLGRYFPDSPSPDDGGLGEPGQGSGSGRTTAPTDQDDLRVAPEISINLTERTALIGRLGYQNVEYDDQVEDDRTNFTDTNGSVGIQFTTSPTSRVSILTGASDYNPETNINSVSQFVNVEWSNVISEVSRVYARGGANRVKTYVIGDPHPPWESGFSGGAGVEWSFEVTELFLEANHYIDPSSSGRMVNRDQLRLELLRRFSERTSLNFAARAIRDDDTGDDDSFETREYYAGSLEYEWRFRREFSLKAGYEYTWRKYENDLDSADSNRLYLGVMYEPHRR